MLGGSRAYIGPSDTHAILQASLRACRSIQREIPGLPISSSPSISTLTLRGSRPASFRYASRALRMAKICPLSRSEEHTSELQSRPHLVCRLLLEKKKHLQ